MWFVIANVVCVCTATSSRCYGAWLVIANADVCLHHIVIPAEAGIQCLQACTSSICHNKVAGSRRYGAWLVIANAEVRLHYTVITPSSRRRPGSSAFRFAHHPAAATKSLNPVATTHGLSWLTQRFVCTTPSSHRHPGEGRDPVPSGLHIIQLPQQSRWIPSLRRMVCHG